GCCTPVVLGEIHAIGEQPAGLNIESECIHGGEPVLGGQLCDSPGVRVEEPAGDHEESASASASRRLERPFDLASVSNLEREQLPPPLSSGGFKRLPRQGAEKWIPEDCHRRRLRNEFLEQLKSLPHRLWNLKAESRDVPARPPEALDEPRGLGVASA